MIYQVIHLTELELYQVVILVKILPEAPCERWSFYRSRRGSHSKSLYHTPAAVTLKLAVQYMTLVGIAFSQTLWKSAGHTKPALIS
jgi:hypothetical protein